MYKQSDTQSLNKKLEDCENTIRTLTEENEEFASQINQLTKQLDYVQQWFASPVNRTSEMSMFDFRSPTAAARPSPSGRSTSAFSTAGKGGGTDRFQSNVESAFANAEFAKASELLAQSEYVKPTNVNSEKFNTWLIMSNRVKDSQLADVLNKLKLANEEEDREPHFGKREVEKTVFERVMQLLDDLLVGREYEGKPTGTSKEGKTNEFNANQLLMKVDYLNTQLRDVQQQANSKEVELRVLRERISDKDSELKEHRSSPERTGNHDNLLRNMEREVRMRVEMEQRLKDASAELNIYRERAESLDRDAQVKQKLLNESRGSSREQNDLVNRLVHPADSL